eukprot:354680-Rhodomonas_salina.2
MSEQDSIVSKVVDLGADVNARDNEVSAQPRSLWLSVTLAAGESRPPACACTALFCAEQHGGGG